MRVEIQWLVSLGVEQKLLELEPCLEIAQSLGENTEIVPFAEKLLRDDVCTQFDALQDLVEEAYSLAQDGNPPENPFEIAELASPQTPQPSQISKTGGDTVSDFELERLKKHLPDLSPLESPHDDEIAKALSRDLLKAVREAGASDLHISSGSPLFIRRNQRIHYLAEKPISREVADHLNSALLTEAQRATFAENRDLEFALSLGSKNRFRVNLMTHKNGVAGTYRIITDSLPQLGKLGFEDMKPIRKLLNYPNGLILIAGPLCSGKSTTLAAIIDELNRTQAAHIISVEQPVEIVQASQNSQITQREVGNHVNSYADALRSALRQDPDIIVIGELRDLKTIEMAISASETGHLVIGTLNTSNAANTLNSVLDVFPANQQTQIRVMLSHALRGIVCQRLVPSNDGKMALAYELLFNNIAVRSLIHENKPEGLANVMETGAAEGMQLMDTSIISLWENDKIADDVALMNIKNDIKRAQLRELIQLQQPSYKVG